MNKIRLTLTTFPRNRKYTEIDLSYNAVICRKTLKICQGKILTTIRIENDVFMNNVVEHRPVGHRINWFSAFDFIIRNVYLSIIRNVYLLLQFVTRLAVFHTLKRVFIQILYIVNRN